MSTMAITRAKGGPWQDWEEEMWRKTALHALYKVLPRSYQMQVSQDVDDEILGTEPEPATAIVRPWQGGASLSSLLSELDALTVAAAVPLWEEQKVADIDALTDDERGALAAAVDAKLKALEGGK